MPPAPTLAFFEYVLLLAGTALFLWVVFSSGPRARWLAPRELPAWPVSLAEFAIFAILIFSCGVLAQMTLQLLLKQIIARAEDREALQLCLNGVGFDGGGLIGWLLFPLLKKNWAVYGGSDLPATPPVASSWWRAGRTALAVLLAAMPVIIVINLGWSFLLEKLGLPAEPQDLIAIFANAKSPVVIAGLLAVACILAPIYEELLFRGGLYRFCRQKIGRNAALVFSGCLFGLAHANWAGFLPLAAFGVVLALAYETSGDIRVPIIAHGLFNLNTVLLVLAGLSK